MENFFGRLKVEMFYGEKFESVNAFIEALKEYIRYYSNDRISTKLKGMSPVQFRTHSGVNYYFCLYFWVHFTCGMVFWINMNRLSSYIYILIL